MSVESQVYVPPLSTRISPRLRHSSSKALKVPQLKELLQKCSVSFGAKATKADLVKKVLETPAALAELTGSKDASEPAPAPVEEDNDDLVSAFCAKQQNQKN